MRTIVVDDEPWMLKRFDLECKDIPDVELLGSFRSPRKALDFAANNHIDLAFLDMEMPEMNGLQLAEQLRQLYPALIVIFVSAYEQYMPEAFRKQIADYYIMKPYDRQDMEAAVARARLLSGRLRKSVSIRTFGSFDVFVDKQPVAFSDEKAKELLALLVQAQGGVVSEAAACGFLWPRQGNDGATLLQYRKTMRQLSKTLQNARLEGLVESNEQGAYLHTDIFDCDLYLCLDGDLKSMRQYAGEYMTGYAWAETKKQALARQSELLGRYSDGLKKNTLCASVHCRPDQRLTITYVNDGFLAVVGMSRQELADLRQNSLRALILREDYQRLLEQAQSRPNLLADAEFRLQSKAGDEIWVMCKCEPGDNGELECLMIDISGLKAEQYQLEQAASHDALTGLLNRGAAETRIRHYLKEYGAQRQAALVLLDVDDFKAVNDTYGHPFADTVLTDIAAILTRSFRSSDIICRLGGDEMLLFIKGVQSGGQAGLLLREAKNTLDQRLRAKTDRAELSCSFGGALCPGDGTDYETLYQRADQALYRAKKTKDCVSWYSESLSGPLPPGAGAAAAAAGTAPLAAAVPGLPGSIRRQLARIGQEYDVSRVYVFELSGDGRFAVNTFEWCAAGVSPEIGNLRQLPADTLAPYYKELFDNDGLFYCYDVRNLSPEIYRIVEPQGIKSMLQYALIAQGEFFGMVGFDECRAYRYWNGKQIRMLVDFAQGLSQRLYAYRQQQGRSLAALQNETEVRP